MKKTLYIARPIEVSEATHFAYSSHHLSTGWVPTQYWRWIDGDAIVGVAGTRVVVAIRRGDRVDVVAAEGLMSALERLGENKADYEVA